MKIGGMGYAILRVTAEQLREIHKVPPEVVFTETLETNRSAWNSTLPPGWYHDEHPFYFRIQHRYLPRTPDRGPLTIFHLPELLEQLESCAAQEEENRGKPVPENMLGSSWVEDDA
jgi:hypothetical protein